MLTEIANPFEVILGLDGKGLNAGKVYIGVANQDPETNPQAVYWDAAGTIPASQPLDTIGGYIWRSGTPTKAYVLNAYSIRVRDRLNNQVFYAANVALPDASSLNFIQAGTGAVTRTAQDKMRERFSPEDFGAVGDGVADDTLAWTRVLTAAAGRPIVGDPSKTYGVTGNLALPTVTRIRDAVFKQLTPNDASRRTLYATAGTYCEMTNVKVNRNGDGAGGSVQDAAGIWLANVANVHLEDVEVTGNDKGTGIVLSTCTKARLVRPNVHDMIAGTAASAAVVDDSLQGIWIIGGNKIVIDSPIVSDLANRWNGQAAWPRFTRGIAVSGAADLSIINPNIDSVDQGIDLTGSENPDRVTVTGGFLTNCYTYGGKCANTVSYARWNGVTARFCGLAGFVVSGWTGGAVQTHDIKFMGCVTIGVGSNGFWAASNTAGYSIQTGGGAYTAYPYGVKFTDCMADGGSGGAMKYGFLCDTIYPGNDSFWNEAIECQVRTATIARYFGLQEGICTRSRTSAVQGIPNNAFTAIVFDTTDVDRMAGSSGASTQIVITKEGTWALRAQGAFATSGTGVRMLRVLKNGATVSGGKAGAPGNAASSLPFGCTAEVPCVAGDLITLELFQDSGGSLNTVTGDVSLTASLVRPGQG